MRKFTRISAFITASAISAVMLGSINANALAMLEDVSLPLPVGYEQFDDKGLLDNYNGPYEAYMKKNDDELQFILHYSYKYNYTTFTVVNAGIETYDAIYEKYSEELGMDYHHRNNVPVAQPDRDVEAIMYDMYDENGNLTADPTVVEDKFDIIQKMAAEMYEAGCISEVNYNIAVCYRQNAYYTGMGIRLNTEDDAAEYDNVEAIVSKYEGGEITSFNTMYYIDADFFAAHDLYDELHAAYPGSTGGVYTTFLDSSYTESTEDIDVIASLETMIITGDADSSGTVDLDDAVLILQHYANTAAGIASVSETDLMDVNSDGSVDLDDAVEVLTIYAETAAGLR